MFESLDEDSPKRMPPPRAQASLGAIAGRTILSLCLAVSFVLERRGVAPYSVSGWVAATLMAIGVVVFALFEYRAYRDRRDGPVDLRL